MIEYEHGRNDVRLTEAYRLNEQQTGSSSSSSSSVAAAAAVATEAG